MKRSVGTGNWKAKETRWTLKERTSSVLKKEFHTMDLWKFVLILADVRYICVVCEDFHWRPTKGFSCLIVPALVFTSEMFSRGWPSRGWRRERKQGQHARLEGQAALMASDQLLCLTACHHREVRASPWRKNINIWRKIKNRIHSEKGPLANSAVTRRWFPPLGGPLLRALSGEDKRKTNGTEEMFQRGTEGEQKCSWQRERGSNYWHSATLVRCLIKEKIHACSSTLRTPTRPLAFSSPFLPPDASVPSSSSSSSHFALSSSQIPFVPIFLHYFFQPAWPDQLMTSPRPHTHIYHCCGIFLLLPPWHPPPQSPSPSSSSRSQATFSSKQTVYMGHKRSAINLAVPRERRCLPE